MSNIQHSWNPWDREETALLVEFVKNYEDAIYLVDETSGEARHGLKQIKELLNTVIQRYKDCIDLL